MNRPTYDPATLAAAADRIAAAMAANQGPAPRLVTAQPVQVPGAPVAPPQAGPNEVDVRDGRIHTRAPFQYKDALKAIGGARWEPAAKTWSHPADGHAAKAVDRAVPARVSPRTPAFEALLATTRAAEEARIKIMQADDSSLAPVPITRLPAWGHQRRAYWSAQGHAGYMLAMDMGTGKTKVALDLIQNEPADRMILICCPKSVVGVWPREIQRHCVDPDTYRVAALRSGSTARNLAIATRTAALAKAEGRRLVLVINYEAAWREDFAKWALAQPWDRVIADESHRIKSATGKASKFMEQLGKRAKRRLALTGTPMAHNPLDIFAQYRFINPAIYGPSWTGFKKRYGAWGGYQGYQLVGILNEEELNKKFYSAAYRVGKEVLDLPPVLPDMQRDVLLSLKARRAYRDMATDFVAWVNEGEAVTADNALVKLLRLQQITSGFLPGADVDSIERLDTAKADALEDLLEDLPQDEPVVVFCRFRPDLDEVRRVAEKLKRRYGELSGRSRDGLTDESTMAPDIEILGAQIQSGGVGIDLTRARYCVYYSLGYSLGDYEQSLARVHRPGQERPVQYVHLCAPGTVDDAVRQALSERKSAVEAVLDYVRAGGSIAGEDGD